MTVGLLHHYQKGLSVLKGAGLQLPGSAAQDGLIHSIFDAGSPVNRKYVEQTEIRKNDPPHGGDSGFFGAVSYLRTIQACKKCSFVCKAKISEKRRKQVCII